MDVFSEIVTWAGRRPAWQQDALRRIATEGSVDSREKDELLALLKNANGVSEDNQIAPRPIPLERKHLPVPTSCGTVVLGAIHSLQNVNALVAEQKIAFKPAGISVVYGENGAGKSGYSRVLKRACRARAAEAILPDVFKQVPADSKARGVFEVLKDGCPLAPIEWNDGTDGDDTLAAMAVFDSKASRLYVDAENELVYRPYGLDLFDSLAALCGDLARMLDTDIKECRESLGSLEKAIAPVLKVLPITERTKAEDIDEVTDWSERDDEALARTEREVAVAIVEDPLQAADRVQHKKRRVESLVMQLEAIGRVVSDQEVALLSTHSDAAKAAAAAFGAASKPAFQQDPLPGIGEPAWRDLLEAARRYSEELAYPRSPFPAVADGARCVLCQQPLTADGKERLRRFWQFLQQDTARRAKSAKDAYERLWGVVADALQRLPSDTETLAEIQESSPAAGEELERCFTFLADRKTRLTAAHERDDWQNLAPMPDLPLSAVRKLCAELETLIAGHKKRATAGERARLETELKKSTEKKARSLCRGEAKEYLRCQQRFRALQICAGATNTREITLAASALAEQLVSERLSASLRSELAEICPGIEVTVKRSGRHGAVRHRLVLSRCVLDDLDPSKVLSEGEQCALAIAAFLAELQATDHTSAVVFDDPVCSLDHMWRPRIAMRLARESKARQVIVFTHDIFFLRELSRTAADAGAEFSVNCIRRRGNSAGVVANAEPWEVMNLKNRLPALRTMAQDAKRLHESDDMEGYRRAVKNFYCHIRETWEQLVEEVVLYGVVTRFSPEVHTKRLQAVIVDDEVWLDVERGMGRASQFMHNQPVAGNAPPPEPARLVSDIDALDHFSKDLRKRQANTRTNRGRQTVTHH